MSSSSVNDITSYYSYYFNGLRSNKGNTKYIYDGKNILAEIKGDEVTFNVYGNTLLFTFDGVENTSVFYEHNLHGDVKKVLGEVATTDENNVETTQIATLNSYKYDAFGVITETVEVIPNTFFYSGYEYDDETGLYYLRSRYYNPEIARFTQEDSFNGYYTDPLSLNKYTYCHNNPVTYNDQNGDTILRVLGGALIGAVVDAGINLIAQAVSGEEIDWAEVGGAAVEGAIIGAAVAAPEVGMLMVLGSAGLGNVANQMVSNTFSKDNEGETFGEKLNNAVNEFDYLETATTVLTAGAFKYVDEVVDVIKAGKGLLDPPSNMSLDVGFDAPSGSTAGGHSQVDVPNIKVDVDVSSTKIGNPVASSTDIGYSSMSRYKTAQGKASDGNQLHHIVEQNQIRHSGFKPEQIHNTRNIVELPKDVHTKITSFYATKNANLDYLAPRDFLKGKSFEFQYNYGLDILKLLGIKR